MATEQHTVRVYYRLESARAERGAQSIAGRLDEVDRAAGSSSASLRTIGVGGSLAAAVTAVAALTSHVVSLNGQAESTAIALAGMMQVGGLTAAGAEGFADAMRMSESTMALIRREAAALPGEAQDFITVFRGGLAGAMRAGLSDPTEIARFTNQFGAVAIALEVDSEQAGRDLNLILSGRAGASVAMWNRLGNAIGRSAKEFNQLDPAERLRLLRGALGQYQPMIDAYSNTWDAIASTASSNATELLRVGGQPLFQAAKSNLKDLNKLFEMNRSALEGLALAVSRGLVGGINDAIRVSTQLFRRFDKWTASAGLLSAFDRLGGSISGVMGAVSGQIQAGNTVGLAGGAIGLAAGGPLGALLGGTLGSALQHTPEISATLANLAAGAGSLLTILGPLIGAFDTVSSVFGGTLAAILPGLSGYLATLLGVVAFVAGGMLTIIGDLWTTVGPSIVSLGAALSEFLSAVGSVLGPVLMWVGGQLLELGRTLSTYLGPAVRWVADALAGLFRWLASRLRSLGVELAGGSASSSASPTGGAGDSLSQRLQDLMGRIRSSTAQNDGAAGHGSAAARRRGNQPARRGNTTVNQHNHYTINEARNPERLFIEIRRTTRQALDAAHGESPRARVARG